MSGERSGWEICQKALGQEEPGEVFAAGVLALENEESSRLDSVLEVAAKSYEGSRGLVSASGWVPYEAIRGTLEPLVHADTPFLRRVGVAGFAIHRKDLGVVLVLFLGSL
ncbi:MAG: hypothetical protein AB7T38_17725 [Nitrospirales bacterium]